MIRNILQRRLSTIDNIFYRNRRCLSTSSTNFSLNSEVASYRLHNAQNGFYWKSRYGELTVPNLTIDDYVWKNISKWEHKVAIACGITGRNYTYGKLRDHSAAVAVRLQTEFGLKRGDVVAICMPNIPEYAIIVLGAIEAGLTISGINPVYTADEISRQLSIINAKLIIGIVENVHTLSSAKNLSKLEVPIVAVKTDSKQVIPSGIIDFNDLMNTTNVDFSKINKTDQNPDDICVLPFSSGTSGLPKGVMLTHNNITANCEMLDVNLPIHKLTLPTTNDFQDVFPCVLPMFHIYAFTIILISKLSLGCKIVTLSKFDPFDFLSMLAEHRATFLFLVPPLILFLANTEHLRPHHLKYVRTITSGAAPLGALDVQRLLDRAPHIECLQGYGMTETSGLAFISALGSSNTGSIGSPAASTDVKICKIDDTTFTGVDVNESGELMLRSPSVTQGYFNNPEANAESLLNGGWLRTGDIACYDQNGLFYIKDRLKELIKVKGYQVPPAELEEVLRSHPNVLDAGVIGVEHAKYGEVPRAFIVKKNGVNVTEKELEEFVKRKVADYKQLLGGVQFIEVLPKTLTGKILRRQLKTLV